MDTTPVVSTFVLAQPRRLRDMHRKSKNFDRLMGNGYYRQPSNISPTVRVVDTVLSAEVYTFSCSLQNDISVSIFRRHDFDIWKHT